MAGDSILDFFSRTIIKYRWTSLFLILVVTGLLAYCTKNLTVNNDYDSWLPANDRVTELFRETDKSFSSNALVFVVLDFEKNSVFHPESLALVEKMTSELDSMDELFNVTSLTNIVDIRDPMETVAGKFQHSGKFNLVVLDEGKYVGFVSRANVFSKYRELLKEFSEH